MLVRRYYVEVTKPDGTVTAGLDHGLCLAVDDVAMNSLLTRQEGLEPWVWLIDEHFDFSQTDTNDDEEYFGHFPVAITSLIPDLFPLVAASAMPLRNVWACCAFDDAHPVWTSQFERLLSGIE